MRSERTFALGIPILLACMLLPGDSQASRPRSFEKGYTVGYRLANPVGLPPLPPLPPLGKGTYEHGFGLGYSTGLLGAGDFGEGYETGYKLANPNGLPPLAPLPPLGKKTYGHAD